MTIRPYITANLIAIKSLSQYNIIGSGFLTRSNMCSSRLQLPRILDRQGALLSIRLTTPTNPLGMAALNLR